MNDGSHDDLPDLIDSSFGEGPASPPVADRLVPARRALRRRRWASGGGTALAVAALVSALAVTTGPGGDGGRAVAPAGGGTATSATETPTPTPTPSVDPVLEPPTGPVCVDAMAVPRGASEYDPETGSLVPLSCSDEQGLISVAALRDLLAAQDQDGGPGESQLVRFVSGLTERLEPRGDAEILAQSPDVPLPESFAVRGQRTAVAQVRDGDRIVWVLARQVATDGPEYIAFPDRQERFDSIQDFLDFARTKYSSGEGLR